MPYATIADLPDNVSKLPKHAKEIYMAAFNSAFKQYEGNEGKAHGTAWAAVKKEYKEVDGRWVAKESTVDVKEALSDNDKRAILQSAVVDSLAVGNREAGPWVRDIYPDSLVYEISGKTFQMSYVIDRKGKVVFGQAERVVPQTVYSPVAESVEAKVDQLTRLASEREDAIEVKESLNTLLGLLDKESLTEEEAKPHLLKADEVIAKLEEAAPMKTEDGQQYPKSAFAYAPEADKPTSWKLRLWEEPAKKFTKAQLGRASAALSPGGFRGNKVEIESDALPAVKRRIRAEYRKIGVEDKDIPKWVRESEELRERVFESCEIDIEEVTKEGISKGIVPVRIIEPGFNTSKSRYYGEQAILDAAEIFDGTKMYSDHPTKEDEKQRPERSIKDWVATLHNTRLSERGNAVGDAHINAGWLKEKIQTLFEQGDLQHLGTSINAIGKGTKQVIEGTKTVFVEKLIKSNSQSVDFVTEAGAGGQAGLRESASDNFIDADLMDIATLREARPDLVEAIEFTIREEINQEVKTKMEQEQKIEELETKVESLTTENTTLKDEKEAQVKEKTKADAQAAIKEAVEKAELPDAAKQKLIEVHKDDETADGIEEAIKDEAVYVATLTEKGKIVGLGLSGDLTEAEKKETQERLAEGFEELTGSKAAGEIAAKGR